MKKHFIILLFCGLTTCLSAQTFGGGSGTQSDPHKISTPAHLKELATWVNQNPVTDKAKLQVRISSPTASISSRPAPSTWRKSPISSLSGITSYSIQATVSAHLQAITTGRTTPSKTSKSTHPHNIPDCLGWPSEPNSSGFGWFPTNTPLKQNRKIPFIMEASSDT